MEEKEILFPFTKRVADKILKIIVQFLCFRFFNKMFNYFSANKLISKNQSSFQHSDSCINQLLSITHRIFTSFDIGLDVKSVFLDIFKAFGKVWHKWLILKLKQIGISGELLHTLSNFLNNTKHKGCAKWSKFIMDQCFMLEFHKDLFQIHHYS